MGFEIQFISDPNEDSGDDIDPDAEEIFDFGSGSDLMAITAYFETLPENESKALRAFMSNGEYTGTDVFSKELKRALKKHPPDRGLAALLKRVLKLTGIGHPGEKVMIID